MTEIKKGDWYYSESSSKVWQCRKVERHRIFNTGGSWALDYNCHRLTPLDNRSLSVKGDRYAVIDSENIDKFKSGDIVVSDDVSCAPFISCGEKRGVACINQLARLPDCAQGDADTDRVSAQASKNEDGQCVSEEPLSPWGASAEGLTGSIFAAIVGACPDADINKLNDQVATKEHGGLTLGQASVSGGFCVMDGTRTIFTESTPATKPEPIPCPHEDWCDLVESATPNKKCYTEKEIPHEPIPCPHPEWEGVWLNCGFAVSVRWRETCWEVQDVKGIGKAIRKVNWDGPHKESPPWKPLEPAPQSATAGPILDRPPKHGGIQTPWDPWEV